MTKRKILNALMVLTVMMIAFCGFMAVKTLKGSGNSLGTSAELSIESKNGIVTVERNGIAYEVEEGSAVRSGDRFLSKKGANITLKNENTTIVLTENSELRIEEDGFYLHRGELFVDGHEVKKFMVLRTRQFEMNAQNAVVTITAQSGAQTVDVYAGEATVDDEKITSGNRISIVEKEDGSMEKETTAFSAAVLSDAQIELLQQCEITESYCFSEQELKQVITVRQEEKEKAQQAQLLLADASKEALKKEQDKYEKALAASQKAQTGTDKVGTVPTSDEVTDFYIESDDTYDTSDEDTDISYEEDDTKYVTIEIRCDTVLNNMQNLTSGKDVYVPGSGTILSTSKIEFEEGETVFEVLKRACSRAGIQMEYRWTPMYESYYIEGINHLYEFDCGNESGWMYKVNGWFPNYGCSSYELEEGDTIVWAYTCNGLGRDLGFEGF